MQFDKTVDDRDRFVRILLAAALALVAIDSFRRDRRLVGALAGVGAVGVGYTAAVKSDESRDEGTGEADAGLKRTTEQTSEGVGMRCSACNEPIVVGQSRRPNADNRIVHENCL